MKYDLKNGSKPLWGAIILLASFNLSGCSGGSGSSLTERPSNGTNSSATNSLLDSSLNSTSVDTTEDTSTPSSTMLPTEQVHVACVGDSITYGLGVRNHNADNYPAVLGRLLGSHYQVNNFGVSGTTASKSTSLWYEKTSAFQKAYISKSDTVIIALGTNDVRNDLVQQNPADFIKGYKEIIAAFKKANHAAKIYVCLPPPMYPLDSDLNLDLQSTLFPLIKKISKDCGTPIIDFYHPLLNKPEYFSDKIHPTSKGAKIIAAQVHDTLT